MEDQQIIALYWQRSELAIVQTAAAYGAYCYQIADNILHDALDDEECCNDTWLRAWNTIPPQKPDKLRPFLAKITRNLAFDRYRTRHAAKRGGGELPLVLEELEQCLPAAASAAQAAEARELEHSIQTFLQQLPSLPRSVFLRRYFYAEPVQHIAQRFSLKDGSVSMMLSRTRRKLKIFLQQEGYFL